MVQNNVLFLFLSSLNPLLAFIKYYINEIIFLLLLFFHIMKVIIGSFAPTYLLQKFQTHGKVASTEKRIPVYSSP